MSIRIISLAKEEAVLRVLLAAGEELREYRVTVDDSDQIQSFDFDSALTAFFRPHFHAQRAFIRVLSDFCQGKDLSLPLALPDDNNQV